VLVTRIAELRIQRTYPAAPLRIWLILGSILSKQTGKSIAKGVISEFSGRLGVYPSRPFVFGETKKPAEADSFVVPHLAMRLIISFFSQDPSKI
jgi:hypothetical protein